MRIIYIFLLCFWSVTAAFAQDYDTIVWEENKKLRWDDFKGIPPDNDRAAATTASGITYRYSASEVNGKMEVVFNVSTHFYPYESWYQPVLCDSVILGHEQLHFDISELYARKLKKELSAATYSKNIKAEVRKIYKRIVKELNTFQNTYDTETNFSRDREKQNLWVVEISRRLKKQK